MIGRCTTPYCGQFVPHIPVDKYWECPGCGAMYIGDVPPDVDGDIDRLYHPRTRMNPGGKP